MDILDLTNINFYILIIVSVVNTAVLCLVSSKLFQIMQLYGYKIKGYNSWIKDTKIKYIGRIFMISFLSLISVLVTNALLDGFGGYYSYLGLIFYFYFCIIFIINMSKIPQKTPLKQTRRMNRLIITTSLLTIVISFFSMAVLTEYVKFIKYGIIVLTPLLMPIIVPLANIINAPIEALIRKRYINKAKSKLKKMPNLVKIGITGSFGKTSTKHILNVILSKKYSVCMTPHSFNTPMGLTKVVLKYLKKDNEILIAEMGARHVGDIKYLCSLINPKHAIITSVGSQHLLTFGSVQNIYSTKNELVDAIDDGYIVFNGSNDGSKTLYDKCSKNRFLSGIDLSDAFCNISNIKMSKDGSQFDMEIDNQVVHCKTKLLGRCYIEDIAMASAMAYKLGVSMQLIKQAISELEPMTHRLELIPNKNGLTIIDNSYNSSVESANSALEVLSLFDGNNKIIATPGIVEMGEKEFEANYNLGKNIATVCDKVIVINNVNFDAIKSGLIDGGFNEEKIFHEDSLKNAQNLISKITESGDVIMFLNDLPDNYT